MKTSRFANVSQFRGNETAISISRWSPSWYLGKVYAKLAPPAELVLAAKAGEIGFEEYKILYEEAILNPLNPNLVFRELKAISENPILLCHEDLTIPGEWCHRRLVAAWLEPVAGEIPEWTRHSKVKSKLVF